ncbi:amidophosphoribosyltransferase [Holotrichia oblita]|nr:amidophosphoribosyltransferase [Holotrichia oblita]
MNEKILKSDDINFIDKISLGEALFKSGLNCAQAVFCAFSEDYGIDLPTAKKLSLGFGAGMGSLREVCGAVSGAFMVLGLEFGETKTKAEIYSIEQEFAAAFKKENSSYICRELLQLSGSEKLKFFPEERTDNYYKKRPCAELECILEKLPFDEKLHEECGVLGFYDNDGFDVARMLYYGMFALQHRGQESHGIVTNDDSKLYQHKDKGLAGEVFNDANLDSFKGNIGVAHVRYATENDLRENAQPIVSRYCKGSLTLAHNGNIINSKSLREDLETRGAIFQSTNDIEVLMHLIAIARTKTHSVEDAVVKTMQQIEGAYSMVLMSPRKLLAIRDPQGFRPLCIGKIKNSYIVASESIALDVIKAEFIRDVEPGEIIVIDKDGLRSIRTFCGKKPSTCIFEYIYFARPDSIIDKTSVYNVRIESGKMLAKTHPVDADVVIGVPDSGLHFAQGYAQESKIPYGEGLIRNRYCGRTFIKQKQKERELAVNIKLNALGSNLKGKRVILVDDSIVRGTTTANLVKLLKENGAKEVHIRIGAPQFLWPCYYGTDIPTKKDLIAVKYNTEEICKKIGADSLGFLKIEDIKNIGLREDFGYCDACFTGNYPINS